MDILGGWQLWTGAIFAALLLLVGHWFPWSTLAGRKMSNLERYVYGVACIWIGFLLWRGLLGDWLTPAGFMLINIGGGLAVTVAYRVDDVALAKSKVRKIESVTDYGQRD